MTAKLLYEGHAASHAQGAPRTERDFNKRDRAIVAWLERNVGSRASVSIVELSVGDGGLSTAIAVTLPSARITGYDISEHIVEEARLNAGRWGISERIQYHVLNLDEGFHTLETSSADVVLAMDIMEHVFDVFGFIEHVCRILKPQGVLALRVPNIAYVRRRFELMLGKLPVTSSWFGTPGELSAWRERWGWDGGHLHYFTLEYLGKLFDSAGLEIREVADVGTRFEAVRKLVPTLLCGNLCVFAMRR